MSPVTLRQSRRSLAILLLAAAAASGMLAGCTAKNPLSPSPSAQLAGGGGGDDGMAMARWSQAYAKSPDDPRVALGYARSLKAIGSKDRAYEVLTTAYRKDRSNGEVASELGRLALEMGRVDIAKATLKTAEAQGVRDWRTLSAQGTLHAKQGEHAAAQQYYLAALQQEPDAVSVINNLALSYALDGKADKAASLLQKTVDAGKGDRRVRQNLALVLGLEGKFDQARQVALLDMPASNAQASMGYLRDMVSSPARVATLDDGDARPLKDGGDWQPYAENEQRARRTATASASPPETEWTSTVTPVPASARPAQVATLTPAEAGTTIAVKSPPKAKPGASVPAPAPITPPAEPAVFRSHVD